MGAPTVAVGDGALGFWAALGDEFPDTREQRCWVHKTANILDALPKRLHRQAKAAIHEIYQAETRSDADAGIDQFVRVYGEKRYLSGNGLPASRCFVTSLISLSVSFIPNPMRRMNFLAAHQIGLLSGTLGTSSPQRECRTLRAGESPDSTTIDPPKDCHVQTPG
jgi:hypothetical protein